MNRLFLRAPDAVRRVLPFLLGLVLAGVLWQKAQGLDWTAVSDAFTSIAPWRWVGAAMAAAISFWAVAQYDVTAHRHFRTGRPDTAARRAGATAIAVGQTTGFGPAVGAALRWRLMPDLGRGTVLRITGFVTLGFFAAWGTIALTLAVPVLAGHAWLGLALLPLGLAAVSALLFAFPHLNVLGRQCDLPSIPAFLQMVALAGCDVLFAGLALDLMLPPETAPALPVLIATFTLALGAGMIGGTPGGVGPFELALVTLLPGTATPELAAALIAFRMVYYAVPCILGASYALLAPPHRQRPAPALRPRLSLGPRAELPIAAQADHRAIATLQSEGTALRTPQTLTLFLGAVEGPLAPLLPALHRAARDENRLPCLYKLTGRDAVTARRAGWHMAAFAVEAVIDTARHDLCGPDYRQLRRFLRKAEEAGLTFGPITAPDWERMTEIHSAWEDSHGAERGLTMGRFCPLYMSDKPLFGAWHKGRLIAFTSWLQTGGTLSLDLVRHEAETPQGTMHGLVQAVIGHARKQGIAEVCLAALPHPALPGRLKGCAGLTRFKASFAPRWRPLYIGAPDILQLALAAADIRRAILAPAPLRRSTHDLWSLDALVDAPPDDALPACRRAG